MEPGENEPVGLGARIRGCGKVARRWARAALGAGPVAALAGLLLALGLARATPIVDRLDEIAFDGQVRLARWWRDPDRIVAPAQDVVIVGIDDESLDALGVPLAMIHASLGRALQAIAAGGPSVVGLDLALPPRSFDSLAPGLDRELMRGLLAVRGNASMVLALDVDAQGRLRVPALPMLAAAGGPEAFGLPLFPLDCDGVVRRFEPDPGWSAGRAPCVPLTAGPRQGNAGLDPSAAPDRSIVVPRVRRPGDAGLPLLPSFVGRMAERIGRGSVLREAGWIDYTRGAPFSFLPLHTVVAWGRDRDTAQLRAHFEGRVVLVGSVLPYLDRMRLPVALAGWQPAAAGVPGLVANAQVLRSVLGAGLVRPLGTMPGALLLLAMASLAFVGRTAWRWALWLLALLLVLVGGAALHAAGWFCAPSQGLLAGAAAAVLRNVADLRRERQERRRLTEALGGYLSPQVLRAILQERAGAAGTRRAVALLFADLRDFTAWSEAADPATVLQTLNRYYGAVTPVLHAHGGTIDNFRGDGIMVMFGGPEARARPCDDALAAVAGMLEAIGHLNRQQAERSSFPLAVTAGLAYGEVVYGDLGSAERKDYTALGDAVNVAARLQDLAKQLGVTVLMTQDFARQLSPGRADLRDLGVHKLKGHSPVAVWGWQLPSSCAAPA
jgi:class 3 adenylate cyclase